MNELAAKPKVSVCVVTYNQPAYIKDCLLSVLMQGCEADLEVLVGDDCSTDGTGAIIQEIAEAYPGRLTVPRRERNLGPSGNYQDLIARATGDYIAHLDGDDYWMPGKLAAQLEFFRVHPDCAAVYSNAHVINEAGELVGTFNNRQPSLFDTDYLLRGGNFLNHCSLLYRAELKQNLLSINREFIDYRMHLRLSRHGKLGYVNQDLVAYRAGTATSMVTRIPDKVRDMYWEALCDPDIADASGSSLILGKANFYARLCHASIRQGRLSYVLRWGARIRRETGWRAYRIVVLSFTIFLSIIWKLLRKKIGRLVGGCQIRVVNER